MVANAIGIKFFSFACTIAIQVICSLLALAESRPTHNGIYSMHSYVEENDKVSPQPCSPLKRSLSLLVGDQVEEVGYGRYSYLILSTQPTEATREHYLQTINDYLKVDFDAKALNTAGRRSEMDVIYVPVDSPAPSNISAKWILEHYNYSRIESWIKTFNIKWKKLYLLSTSEPLSQLKTLLGEQYSYRPLSRDTLNVYPGQRGVRCIPILVTSSSSVPTINIPFGLILSKIGAIFKSNLVEVSLNSIPAGAEVYLIPYRDWEKNACYGDADTSCLIKNNVAIRRFQVSEGNTPVMTPTRQKVFMAVFILNSQVQIRRIDVIKGKDNTATVTFSK